MSLIMGVFGLAFSLSYKGRKRIYIDTFFVRGREVQTNIYNILSRLRISDILHRKIQKIGFVFIFSLSQKMFALHNMFIP